MQIYLTLEQAIETINRVLWGPVLTVPMLLIGLWFSIRLHFFQFTGISVWLKQTVGRAFRHSDKTSGISPFQTLATALAGTMGTGNIVGVAAAIAAGGPGTVFWMWLSALFGMMTKYAETVLAVRFRRRGKSGEWQGGAMEYMEHGLHCRWMSLLFGVFCVFASFGMGNMTQVHSISSALSGAFGAPPRLVGLAVALLLGLIICGGIRRIAGFAEKLIPSLSILYTLGGLVVIFYHSEQLPVVLRDIFRTALLPQSVVGGVAGYGIQSAMRYGFARGIFSNEAGLGSSGMVYATAEHASPAEQGMWGIFEVFADTILVCTVTALAILTAVPQDSGLSGAALTIAAFSTVFGRTGSVLIAVAITLFAFASMVGWAYYGERGMCRLAGRKSAPVYRALFLICAALGAVLRLELVWGMSEIFNALMALPNLIALLWLTPQVLEESEEFLRQPKVSKRRNG